MRPLRICNRLQSLEAERDEERMMMETPTTRPAGRKWEFSWKMVQEHEQALSAKLRRVDTKGKSKKAEYWTRCYLQSFDARLVATERAFRSLPLHRRPPMSRVPDIAANLRPWRGTDEEVALSFPPKETNPDEVRTIMNFGIENRALQYQVLHALEAGAKTHPMQFATRGGTRAAIKAARNALLGGHHWAAEIDISSCYPSFDEERLSGLLPVPKEVVEKVILSRDLNLTPDRKWLRNSFGVGYSGSEAEILFSSLYEDEIEAARRGIPQGSAVSPLVAECLLAPVLAQMPNHGIVLNYADNFLVMAKQEAEVVSMQQTLRCALKAHPAGPLLPKKPKSYGPGQAVEFLGHILTFEHGACRVEPSPKNAVKFKVEFERKLKHAMANNLSPYMRRRRFLDLLGYIVGWSNAFSLWKGAIQHRKQHMETLKAAATSCSVSGI